MKFISKTGIFLTMMTLALTSCGEKYQLPNIENMSKEEVIEVIGDNLKLNFVDVPTYKYIEGKVMGYADKEAGDNVSMNSKIDINVSQRSANAVDHGEDSIIAYTSQLYKNTGAGSNNEQLCADHGVGSTDLGIPFTLPDGRIMMMFGDTFSGENKAGFWNSNFMAITSDFDLSDGLTFDELVVRPNNMIKPFAQGNHQDDNEHDKTVEVTKIPTGGISVNGEVYIYYMSVRWWGPSSSWNVTYNQCVKASRDAQGNLDYTNFVEVPGLRWNDDELFYAGQIYPIEEKNHPDHIYFMMTAGGRHHGTAMMRVRKDSIENKEEYEYLVGANTWVKGSEGVNKLHNEPYFVIDGPTLEPNCVYNPYLKKYVSINRNGLMRLSSTIDGKYDETYILQTPFDAPEIDAGNGYGFFLHEKFMDYGGQRMYLQVSRWITYNTFIHEIVLK